MIVTINKTNDKLKSTHARESAHAHVAQKTKQMFPSNFRWFKVQLRFQSSLTNGPLYAIILPCLSLEFHLSSDPFAFIFYLSVILKQVNSYITNTITHTHICNIDVTIIFTNYYRVKRKVLLSVTFQQQSQSTVTKKHQIPETKEDKR